MTAQEIQERVAKAVASIRGARVEVRKYPYEFVVKIALESDSQGDEVQKMIQPVRREFEEQQVVVFFEVGTPLTAEKLPNLGTS